MAVRGYEFFTADSITAAAAAVYKTRTEKKKRYETKGKNHFFFFFLFVYYKHRRHKPSVKTSDGTIVNGIDETNAFFFF